MDNQLVVAAAIVDSLENPTQLLCAARSYPKHLAGKFELPGGKVEDNESAQDALHREIYEELGTKITLGTPVAGPHNGLWPILQGRHMSVWLAEIRQGAASPTRGSSHMELRWVSFENTRKLAWIGNDGPIVEAAIQTAIRQ